MMDRSNWPTSLPDYQWPETHASRGMTAMRFGMAAAFHCAYAIGLGLGSGLRWLKTHCLRVDALPTLIIRTDGVGDALLFEPAIESLARTCSPSEIHLWAPKATCELFAECPTITRRIATPRGGKDGNLRYFRSLFWRAKLGFHLGFWRFEKAIYPVQSPEPLGNWLLVTAQAEQRWVNAGDTQNQFDWQQTKTHDQVDRVLEQRPGSAHEILRNEHLANQWTPKSKLRRPRVHLSQDAAADAERMMKAWRRAADRLGANDIVGLVVAGTSDVNRYPPQHWATTISKLWEDHRAIVALVGGPNDQPAMDEVARQLGATPHFRLMRPVSLLTLSALIRNFNAMLSVDTGAAHIAVAMRVPTVVLVGGGHPGRFFPWPKAAHHVVLNVAMPCDGCMNRCHMPEPHCVTRIRPEDILDAYCQLRVEKTQIQPFVVPEPVPAVAEPRKRKRKAVG